MGTFTPIIHTYTSSVLNWFVNAFVVETEHAAIVVDGGIAVSSGREIRKLIDEKIRKPVLAALLTHGHPDHYTGVATIVRSDDVPFLALQGAIDQARSRDHEESAGMKQFFGTEYPERRFFPNQVVKDGDVLMFDDVAFQIKDCGACESDSDGVWTIEIEGVKHLFIGDLIYNHMHAFFRDGHALSWLALLERWKAELDLHTVLHTGHGKTCGTEIVYWQQAYIETFLATLKALLDERETLTEEQTRRLFDRLKSFLPNDDLIFLTGFRLEETIRVLSKAIDKDNYSGYRFGFSRRNRR